MDFKEKIDAILKAKGITLNKLCSVSGLGGTLEKAYQANRPMRPASMWKFLELAGVNWAWFENGEGEILNTDPRGSPENGNGKPAAKEDGGALVIIDRLTVMNSDSQRAYFELVAKYTELSKEVAAFAALYAEILKEEYKKKEEGVKIVKTVAKRRG